MPRSAFITFGVNPPAEDPGATAASLVAAFSSAGSLFSVIDSQVTMIATRVSQGTDGGGDLVGASSQPVACTETMLSLPPNCAFLVHKTTARGGRRGRGRMYVPWAIQGTECDEAGLISAPRVTKMTNAITAWSAAVNSLVGPLVLLHRESGEEVTKPSVPGPPNNVTGHRVDNRLATQRRRLDR